MGRLHNEEKESKKVFLNLTKFEITILHSVYHLPQK